MLIYYPTMLIILPELITVDKRDGQPFVKVSNQPGPLIELSYYANTIVPHFALESIMVTALNNLYKNSGVDDLTQVS